MVRTRRGPDPVHEGRPLSEWVALWGSKDGKLPPPQQREKAARAIQQIGSNAVPTLLAWMDYDPPFSRYRLLSAFQRLPPKILASHSIQSLLYDREKGERAQNARDAFALLGPQANAAIPALIRRTSLNGSPFRRSNAMLALAYFGKAAVPTMAALLANDQATNGWMVTCIRELGTNATPLVPIVIRNLTHTNVFAAINSAAILGELKLDPDLAVPALTNCMLDPRPEVRLQVVLAIMEFGQLATNALPALTNALADPFPDVRKIAANAVEKIVPQ